MSKSRKYLNADGYPLNFYMINVRGMIFNAVVYVAIYVARLCGWYSYMLYFAKAGIGPPNSHYHHLDWYSST